MDWQGWFTLGVLALVIAGLLREVAGPDFVLTAGLCALAVAGVLQPAEAFAGFANPSVVAIGALFLVSAGLRETGLLDRWIARLLARQGSERGMLVSLCAPLAALSAFLNNAPIVAAVTPVLLDWSRRQRIAPSRLLIPVSYATILGSSTTMLGTSVNLTVAGLLVTSGLAPMTLFELAPVGLAVTLAGLAFLAVAGQRLLPSRQDPAEHVSSHSREYVAGMRVEASCPLVGQTIQAAGLRQLPGLFLIEIDRAGRSLAAVAPDEVIQAGDELVFAGVVATIADLQRIPGLLPTALETRDREATHLIEAVVSSSSPLVQRTVKDAQFRTVYDAAVVAVHRNGERLPGKIGEIVMRPGDTLLLQARPGFLRAHRNSPDFYLVSEIASDLGTGAGSRPGIALAIFAAMVIAVGLGWLHVAVAAMLAGSALLASGCLRGAEARRSVDWSVLVVIGAGFGLARAMHETGAAQSLGGMVAMAGSPLGAYGGLVAIYLASMLLAELLHHAAAAAIMVPIALATAGQFECEPRAFAMAVAVGATCAFANPTTYHTHLIVYGPGGYRFADFLRVGLPLDGICAVVALLVIPLIWPLSRLTV
ncbi:MAG: SLC13 family permease [Myxococcales bacterium]|nr:SLC13 family permease [Myxococcales bacterium]